MLRTRIEGQDIAEHVACEDWIWQRRDQEMDPWIHACGGYAVDAVVVEIVAARGGIRYRWRHG